MPAPSPKVRTVSQIKSKLLRPALTSHYECFFNPPQAVRDKTKGLYDADYLSLACCDASLPGSQFSTHEMNNDFTGVTERNAYRRVYDDRADFTFYVDHDYKTIRFFETWMSFIANEAQGGSGEPGTEKSNHFYRFNYPSKYKSDTLYITKFERDYGKSNGSVLQYRFFQAFPLAINSIPVSYESSSLLKCTVSFSYVRYLIDQLGYPATSAGRGVSGTAADSPQALKRAGNLTGAENDNIEALDIEYTEALRSGNNDRIEAADIAVTQFQQTLQR
jgi:hypothetical protein